MSDRCAFTESLLFLIETKITFIKLPFPFNGQLRIMQWSKYIHFTCKAMIPLLFSGNKSTPNREEYLSRGYCFWGSFHMLFSMNPFIYTPFIVHVLVTLWEGNRPPITMSTYQWSLDYKLAWWCDFYCRLLETRILMTLSISSSCYCPVLFIPLSLHRKWISSHCASLAHSSAALKKAWFSQRRHECSG